MPAQIADLRHLERRPAVRQRQRLRQGHHRQPLEGRPEAPDDLRRRAQGRQGRRRRPRRSSTRCRPRAPSPPSSPSSSSATRRARSSASPRPRPCWSSHGHDAGHPRPDARRPRGSRARAAAPRWPAISATAWSAGRGAREARVAFRDILGHGRRARRRRRRSAAAAPGADEPRPRAPALDLPRRAALPAARARRRGADRQLGRRRPPATPPPPQVITVGGAAAAPGRDDAGGDDEHAGGLDVVRSERRRRPSRARTREARRPRALDGRRRRTRSVKDLNSSSGADYQKKSQKLPKQVGTSGKPPPKDNKPAGGGSDFQDIG